MEGGGVVMGTISTTVIPAKAGISLFFIVAPEGSEIPAFAGMTALGISHD
tara:strand:- start:1132 stop:1281 length:150 start_codon:yes stop_codon:yes gene_type:complete